MVVEMRESDRLIYCPYCGSSEDPMDELEAPASGEVECSECEKVFDLVVIRKVIYRTEKVEE